MSNRSRVLVWACAIVLALAFVFAGVTKLGGASGVRWSARFAGWGYPAGTSFAVGVLEVLAGLGVLLPRWRRPAAMTLIALMIGAACTHLLHAEFPRLVPPLVLGGLALLVTFHREGASRDHAELPHQ